MCTFGVLWLSCEAPAAPTRPGRRASHQQPENSKRAYLRVPALQTPPKFHEKTPREGRKKRILRREREKKERNFGRSKGRAVPGRTVLGHPNMTKPKLETKTHTQKPHSETVKPLPTPHRQHTPQHNKSNSIWPKVGLAKVGRQKGCAKSRFGQSRP